MLARAIDQIPKNHTRVMMWAAMQTGDGTVKTSRSEKLARHERIRFAKRDLSPLRRACISLGLKVDAQPKTNLARLLRKAGLGKTAIEYLKFSSDEQARRILDLYYALNATERKAVTIDYLIMAAGADSHHVWGVLQEGLSKVKGAETALLACMNAPGVTQKAVEYALTPGGHADRELILRILGVAPALSQPRRPA
jgi:hypothetical protein